jgi:hypothetical protein
MVNALLLTLATVALAAFVTLVAFWYGDMFTAFVLG